VKATLHLHPDEQAHDLAAARLDKTVRAAELHVTALASSRSPARKASWQARKRGGLTVESC
jgi:hypothetical protein